MLLRTRRRVAVDRGPIPPNSTEVRLEHGPMWYCLNGECPSILSEPPFSLWRYVSCARNYTRTNSLFRTQRRHSKQRAKYYAVDKVVFKKSQ